MCVCRSLCLWLLLPLATTAAQNPAPNFGEIAAQAAAAREVNDTSRAIELYTQALQLDPKWQDGWWSLGVLDYASNNYTDAIEAFSRLLTLKPDAREALALRGLCEFKTRDYEPSLADIQKGLSLGAGTEANNQDVLRYHQAMLLTRLGEFQEALHSYSFFAVHRVTDPELLIATALAGLHMPLLPEDTNPEQRPFLTAVGSAILEFMEGNGNDAEKAFDGVFQQFPAARNVHFLYGDLLFDLDPDAAIPQFKRELEIAPDNADAAGMLAWSLLMKNRPGEALPYARLMAEQQAERAFAQIVLGRALLDTGDASSGIEHLYRALKLEPENIEGHIALAKAYSKSGRDEEARRERTLCLQMTKMNAVRFEHP